ncbi:hypothetical protein HRI_003238700 [Hibiscus trionum]|uniref:Reverse transcriptase Ty1/copia-type domain-containing protein n=1 Tax=Hibiscus trionum TaxID=183268 RepID=A0A9W7IJ13_HIBTR|nr:hypothetical protein HRI_003238700 [Hibiscus trionum]
MQSLSVYVDDLLIIGNDEGMIKELKEALHQKFKMKDLRELKYFDQLEVLRSKEGILLNLRKYTLELIQDIRGDGPKHVSTPLEQNNRLATIEYDEGIQQSDNIKLLDDKTHFKDS